MSDLTAADPGRRPGLIVAFEGIDGAGKTAQTNMLLDSLRLRGGTPTATGPYVSTDIGVGVKKLVTGQSPYATPSVQAALLLAAQLANGVRLRELQTAGQFTVMDRNWLSSIVYQGIAAGEPDVTQFLLHGAVSYAQRWPCPHVVFFLQISPERAQARLQEERKEERFKARGLDWAQKLADGYQALVDAIGVTPGMRSLEAMQLRETIRGFNDSTAFAALRKALLGRFIPIDADRAPADVHADVMAELTAGGLL